MTKRKTTTRKQENNLKAKYGIVVMLDALGARNFSIEDAKSFVKARKIILGELEPARNLLTSLPPALIGASKEKDPIKYATFGDTIILTWHIPSEKTDDNLSHLSVWLVPVIKLAMEHKILLRGAISIGKYIHDGATVLGPAISEAATWYEKASWIGIIATPSCASRLSSMSKHAFFRQYPVPLKKEGTSQMWALEWPHEFFFSHNEHQCPVANTKEQMRNLFMKSLSKFEIPADVKDKFTNTVSFFDWYLENTKHPADV